jgi:DNA-binding CsgD family transcriptional regulator
LLNSRVAHGVTEVAGEATNSLVLAGRLLGTEAGMLDATRLRHMPAADKHIGFTLGNGRRVLRERDRLLLTLLRPHLSQAYQNARQLAAAFSRPRNLRAVLEETWGLTSRESEVAFWVEEGKTNPEIALILGIAARTVEKHMERVLAKLHLENRVAVALRLQRLRAGDRSD